VNVTSAVKQAEAIIFPSDASAAKRYLMIVQLDANRQLVVPYPDRWWHYWGWRLAGAWVQKMGGAG